MGKLNKNQHGFTGIGGILALAVIVLIGVVGFMVYNNHKKANPVATAAVTTKSSTATTITPAKTTSTPAPTTTTDTGSLVIKEWGVTFKLDTPSITQPQYSVLATDASTGSDKVELSNAAVNSETACSGSSAYKLTGTEVLYRNKDATKAQVADSSAPVKIGDYYYSIERDDLPVTCNSDDPSLSQYYIVKAAYLSNWQAGNLKATN